MNSIKNLLEKELKNTGTKKLNDDILVNEVNIIGKKIKKWNFINWNFSNNCNKQWNRTYYESN